jgi:hypothetical protein
LRKRSLMRRPQRSRCRNENCILRIEPCPLLLEWRRQPHTATSRAADRRLLRGSYGGAADNQAFGKSSHEVAKFMVFWCESAIEEWGARASCWLMRIGHWSVVARWATPSAPQPEEGGEGFLCKTPVKRGRACLRSASLVSLPQNRPLPTLRRMRRRVGRGLRTHSSRS